MQRVEKGDGVGSTITYQMGRLGLAICAFTFSTVSWGANWTDTEAQALSGSGFHEPFNTRSVSKNTLTLQNASGFDWGNSYAFVDYLKSDTADHNADEFYGEVYAYPSLSKLTGTDLKSSLLKDVSLTLGVNTGEKSTGANPRVLLAGLTFNIDVPQFSFFDIGVNAYLDRSQFKGQPATCQGDGLQITPAWQLPFHIGRLSMRFEGFLDYTSGYGGCVAHTLAQPQLRVDIGDLFGMPKKLYAGIEYQYWQNKFGIQGLNDEVPQALVVWKF
jgi:nucleoside-specific outer membrane channel protein Tsx